MTIEITRENLLDCVTFAWMMFIAAFIYIGVIHLETISRCLVIQTELMVKGSQPSLTFEPSEPQPTPDPPSSFEAPADPRRGDRI